MVTTTIDTSARVSPVTREQLEQLSELELAQVETLLAGFPPTSVVAMALRDVTAGLDWAVRRPDVRGLEVTTVRQVIQEELGDTYPDGCVRGSQTDEQHLAHDH